MSGTLSLSNKTCMVWDLSGSYAFIAETMVGAFGQVFYHSQWESGFSRVSDFIPGVGLEGIDRVVDPFEHLDSVDLVIFPDVGLDGLQQWLRSQGILVWGSAAAGVLERDRFLLKDQLEAHRMDVADYEVIEGLADLRKYLADPAHAGEWVKISYFRGVTETHKHFAGFASQGWTDDIAIKLGPFQQVMRFLVEKPIEGKAVESGLDIYGVNGKIPQSIMWGYENKDAGYLGCCGARLPSRLEVCTAKFLPILVDYDYCGPFSTEVRSTDEDQDFVIDFTGRFPSPPSEAQCLNIENLPEIIYQGARGILVEPDFRYRFAAQFVVKSDVLESHAVGIKVGMPERALLHGHCRIEGKDYAVSPNQIEEFAGAVGLADSMSDACDEAFEAAESIEGDRVSFSKDALREILETIEAGEKLGLGFGEFDA
jgi:hypothetical protein